MGKGLAIGIRASRSSSSEKRKLLTGRWPYTGYEAGGVDRPLYKLVGVPAWRATQAGRIRGKNWDRGRHMQACFLKKCIPWDFVFN